MDTEDKLMVALIVSCVVFLMIMACLGIGHSVYFKYQDLQLKKQIVTACFENPSKGLCDQLPKLDIRLLSK